MRIAALQFDMVWEDRQANFERVQRYAVQASAANADLFVLPEMFATGFTMNPSATFESLDGDTPRFMRDLAQRHRMAVIGGLVLGSQGNKGHNVAIAIDRTGRDLGVYVKSHLIGLLGEDVVHEPGPGPAPVRIESADCACFICYDLRFPELFRLVAEKCQIALVIASWPQARQAHWDLLLRARAVENQLFVVGVNRVGMGGGLEFEGGTAIIDPMGDTLASAENREELIIADIDPARVVQVREDLPFLNDRRF